MKTKKLTSILVALFAIFTMSFAKAQPCMPATTIKNDLACPVTVQVQVYNNTTCTGAPCNSYSTIIPAFTAVQVMCGTSCSTPGCIRVTVTNAGAGPVSAGVTINSPGPVNFAAAASCGTGAQGTITYIAGITEFYIN